MPSATFAASPFAPRKPASASGGTTTSAAPAPTIDHAGGATAQPPSIIANASSTATSNSTTTTASSSTVSSTISGGVVASIAPPNPPEDSTQVTERRDSRHIRGSTTAPLVTAIKQRPSVEPQKADEPSRTTHSRSRPQVQQISPSDGRSLSSRITDRPLVPTATSAGSSRSSSTGSSTSTGTDTATGAATDNATDNATVAVASTSADVPAPQDDSSAELERKSAAAAVAAAAFGANSPFSLGSQSTSLVVPQQSEAVAGRETRYAQQPPPTRGGVYPPTSSPYATGGYSSPASGGGIGYGPATYSSEHAEGPWSKDELVALLDGMMLHGRRWRMLTNCIGSRTSSQVRQKGLSVMTKLNRHFGLQLSSVTSRSSNELHPRLHEILKQQQHNFDHLVAAIEPTSLLPDTTPQPQIDHQRSIPGPKSAFVTTPSAQHPPQTIHSGGSAAVVGSVSSQPLHHHRPTGGISSPISGVNSPPTSVSNDKGEPGWERRVQEVNALNKGSLPPWSNAYVFPNCAQVAQNMNSNINTRKRKVRKDESVSSTLRQNNEMHPDGAKRLKTDTESTLERPLVSSSSVRDSDDEKSKFFADLFDQEATATTEDVRIPRPQNSSVGIVTHSAVDSGYADSGGYDGGYGGGYGGRYGGSGVHLDDEDISGDSRLAQHHHADDVSDDDYMPAGPDMSLKTARERQRSAARRAAHRRRSEARRRAMTDTSDRGFGTEAEVAEAMDIMAFMTYPPGHSENPSRLNDDGAAMNISSSSGTAFRRPGDTRSASSTFHYSGATSAGVQEDSTGLYPSTDHSHATATEAEVVSSSSSQHNHLLSTSLLHALESALGEVQENSDTTTATKDNSGAAYNDTEALLNSVVPTILGTNFNSRVSVAAAWAVLTVSMGLLTGGVDAQSFLWTACRASAVAAAAMVEAAHTDAGGLGTVPDTAIEEDKDTAVDTGAHTSAHTGAHTSAHTGAHTSAHTGVDVGVDADTDIAADEQQTVSPAASTTPPSAQPPETTVPLSAAAPVASPAAVAAPPVAAPPVAAPPVAAPPVAAPPVAVPPVAVPPAVDTGESDQGRS